MTQTTEKPIVFFDGVCGLCNSLVDFLIRNDKKRNLQFAPIQGKTGARVLSDEERNNLDSMVLYSKGKKYYRSTAVLRMFGIIGGFWSMMLIFYIVPTIIRNPIYNLIATNRYKWFGKKESCRMPTKEERSVLLD